MSGFFAGIFGGATEEEKARLVAQGQQEIVDDENSEMQGRVDEDLQREVRANRPPDFLDNIYPPVPDPREFSSTEVWERSSVSDVEQENVERAQHLLSGLPPETPDAVKRQIVEAAFKAFDVSIEDIVLAASKEIDALRDYIADASDRAERFKSASEERIGELEAEIERIRGTIRDAEQEREQLVGSALELIEDVEPVLKFFGNEGGVATLDNFGGSKPPVVVTTQVDDDLDDLDDLEDLEDAVEQINSAPPRA